MKIIGSILLIIAISIGGGLLSLPLVTASSGFYYSCISLIIIWLLMTMGALYVLEACLRFPKGSNFFSMAKDTFGTCGQIIIITCYLILLYSIMCVYTSGGTDLVNSIFSSINIHISPKYSTLIFVICLGAITWHGIQLVDKTNRFLMSIKMFLLLLLILILLPSIKLNLIFEYANFYKITETILPITFSFGYAVIIPSLRDYLDSDVKALRFVIIIGSTIPLICFILWIMVIQGVIPNYVLQNINHSNQVISALNMNLSKLNNPWITTIIHLFTTICLLTAFLAVSLSLSDAISNGLNQPKEAKYKWIIALLTFIPPLSIILFEPYIFITAIRYAGVLVAIVLVLFPTLMILKLKCHHRKYNNAIFNSLRTIEVYVVLVMSILFLTFTIYELLIN